MKELLFFILALIVLGVLWGISGEHTNMNNRNKPFLDQPIDGGRPYTLQELKERTRP